MEFRRLISLLILSLAMSRCVHGQWSSAHATFYGGGDASGTMGKNQNPASRMFTTCYFISLKP